MTAHPETTAHAGAWVDPMAIQAAARSPFAAFDNNEHRTAHPSRGKAAGADAHSHVRCGHGLSHMARVGDDPKLRSSFHLIDVSPCELAPVSAGVPFTRIQIGRLLRLPQIGVQRCIARPHFHSVRLIGANRSRAQSVSDELLQNLALSEVNHNNRLSNPSSFAGSINASKRGQKVGNSGQVGAA